MPQVPTYNRQVDTVTPVVPTPQAPDTATIGLNALNKGFEANQNLAKTVGNIGDLLAQHAAKQQELKNDQIDSQVYTNYARDMQDKLFNQNTETIKVNGQDVTRPIGLMNRELGQTAGSTQQLDEYYFKTARQQYLDQIPDQTHKTKVSAMMDTHFDTVRGTVIGHEASQGRKDLINTQTSTIQQQINDAYGADNPIALHSAIDNGAITTDSLNKASGFDEATSKINLQKVTSGITENSVMGILKSSGDTNKAYAQLDAVKDKLSPENYGELKGKIAKIGDSLEKQLNENLTKQKVANRFDYIDQIASGKLTWDNSGEAIKKVSQSDQELAEAMQKVVTTPDYSAQEGNNDAYQAMVKGIFNSGSQEEVSKFLVDALNAKSNGEISRDRLAILVSAAQQRAQNLPPTTHNVDGSPQNPAQIAIDAGLKAATGWNDVHGGNDPEVFDNYLMSIKNGKQPKEAYDIAIKTSILKAHPEVAAHDDVPNMVVSRNSPTKYIFTGSTRIAPHRIYSQDKAK